MSNELIKKIKAEFLKSGFPLELQCRRVLFQHKWGVTVNKFYTDSEGVEQEVDCIGHKQTVFSAKGTSHRVLNSMAIIECKKNKANHWVFFGMGGIQRLCMASTLNMDQSEYLVSLRGKSLHRHHYLKLEPAGSFSMAFKSKSDKNQIFEAVNDVLNAYKYGREDTEKNMSKRGSSSGLWINVYYPTIVFDGKLFFAELVEDDLELREVDRILYTMLHPSYLCEWVSIDIVRADVFSNYLDDLDKDHEIIASHIKSLK